MSIALEVCRMTEEHVGAEQLPNVVAVALEVGDGAGVEPDSLQFCLEVLLSSPPFRLAKPQIQRRAGDELRLRYVEIDDERPLAAGACPAASAQRRADGGPDH